MGCGCGKFDKLERYEQKYSRYGSGNKSIKERPKLIQNIIINFEWVLKFFFGIMVFCIFVILIIPFMIYIVVMLTMGKEIFIDIHKIFNKILKKNNG